ncbi:fumarylacetoacetase [Paraburkholderia dipogonis]|uniref:fumarylacetoacetase n=1 Tax=Paraburkholderia dipogonis TaxID=1211383 RepID=UPI0038BDE868
MSLDHTHDVSARSWLASANHPASDFPLQNLPYAIFRRRESAERFRAGIALGDQVIDLAALVHERCLDGLAVQAALACTQASLNAFFSMGSQAWRALRHAVFALFEASAAGAPSVADRNRLERCLVAQTDVEYSLPVSIGDYTDFYTSIDHARNIVKLLRPDASLSPNFQWMPVAYHGRVSSIGLSGEQVRRPLGQRLVAGQGAPELAACARLDYELELGIFIGVGNSRGEPISIDRAEEHVFGLCLLNDWSARDIQMWESTPLGPFLAKNFATTISPWIVTMDALAPFRHEWARPADQPQPLPYLDAPANQREGGLDIQLEVWLESERQRTSEGPATRLSRTSFRHQYWTVAQMVTHHAVGGCNLRSGDLLGSGTISGPTAAEAGALIELTAGGRTPVALDNGETRSFLEDGDTVVMKGWCERSGFARIGFGENRGKVVPARVVS